jgi:hypothetical protein
MSEKLDRRKPRAHRGQVERTGGSLPHPAAVHHTELPEGPADSPIAIEWNFYRRIVGQLLGNGYEGKWLLLKNEEIVSIWDTEAEADRFRIDRFPQQAVLMKQILTHEPVLRIGFNRLCRS